MIIENYNILIPYNEQRVVLIRVLFETQYRMKMMDKSLLNAFYKYNALFIQMQEERAMLFINICYFFDLQVNAIQQMKFNFQGFQQLQFIKLDKFIQNIIVFLLQLHFGNLLRDKSIIKKDQRNSLSFKEFNSNTENLYNGIRGLVLKRAENSFQVTLWNLGNQFYA
ncbi:unnamed protein product [Paramecium octaurelia]|uniref:Uncharacterized protein n=1 Tax=Paramecium octaurelia TaxID=43137 RepID=A0A8S1Y3P9_PAROT|nr:unnamed protein product [Paramecium octaurelia]